MQRCVWVIGLSLSCAPAAAADLLRCVTPAGDVAWQQAPCGEGASLTKTIQVDPELAAAGNKVKSRAASPAKPKSTASAGSGSSKPTARRDARSRQRENCAAAKAERDRKLEALGLSRTFEHLRALDDKVRQVCRDL